MPRLRCLLAPLWAVLLSLPLPPRAEPIALPDMGSSAGAVISPQQERDLGEAFMRRLRQDVTLVDDPALNGYLERLGQRLRAAAGPDATGFNFFLVQDPSINAFAGPGGHIGIHTGLFLAAENESELAAVLAHEIAHVTQHHLARAYEAADRMSLPTAAAMLAAILVGTQSPEAGQAALMAVHAGAIQQRLNFTRANEKEADYVGMQLLTEAGFDPGGMPGFFERLSQSARYSGARPPEFLSTHPVTTDRIADAQARAAGYRDAGAHDSLDFQLNKARAQVLTADDPQRVLNALEAGATPSMPTEAVRYARGLALMADGQPRQALALLTALHEAAPDRLAYITARGQALLAAGETEAALAHFEQALADFPNNPLLTLYYSEALLQAGRAADARARLERLVQRDAHAGAHTWRLLARAAQASGDRAASHRAMAEFYYRRGQVHAAIDQLNLALRNGDLDFYETAALEARLEALKRQVADEAPASPTRGKE